MVEKEDLHLPDHLREKLFMIRNCAWYEEEYADCKSVKGRFHQYFVHGELLDCSQWKRDSANCYRWTKENDRGSLEELVNIETQRREERLRSFQENPVWENRTKPPENWNSPLPDWLVEDYQNTYLALKAHELKETDIDRTRTSLCSIM